MKLLKHILAVVIGIAAFVFAYGICSKIIEFVGGIPIIGKLLYYPSDASGRKRNQRIDRTWKPWN